MATHERDLPGLDRRLTPPTADRWGRRLTRGKVAPVLVGAALGSILIAAPVAAQVVDDSTTTSTDTTAPDSTTTETTSPIDTTTSSIDPFDTSTTVTSVEGDSSSTDREPITDFKKKGRVVDVQGDGVNQPTATGSIALLGGDGLEWYLNDDITFSTTSSASGAMSEASFTTSVTATTVSGGTTMSSLSDAFDGYNSLCVDVSGGTDGCPTGTSGVTVFNQNGPASLECSGRSAVFATQNVDDGSVANLNVQRRVFVPTEGEFARWLNTFTNVDSAPATFQANIDNNLGSDSNTISTGSSSGGPVANGATWFGTMQDYSGTTSSDVRLGHVLSGTGSTGTSYLTYVDGDDNPTWGYAITLAPGESVTIANFATGAGTKAQANALAASIAGGTQSGQWDCMTDDQKASVLNFQAAAPPTTTTTVTPTTAVPTTEAPAAEAEQATGTLPYTGAGGELLPLAGAGAAAMAAGGAAVAATKRKLRRPRFRHGR